jgi:hypothetical protein
VAMPSRIDSRKRSGPTHCVSHCFICHHQSFQCCQTLVESPQTMAEFPFNLT